MPGLSERYHEHISRGGTIVAATHRLARAIRRQHSRAMQQRGARLWPTPDVVPLDAWLARLWRSAGDADPSLPRLLAAVEADWLWRGIIARAAGATVLDPSSLAGAARRSWARLLLHGGALDALRPGNDDQEQFLVWARAYESTLAGSGWIDADALLAALAALPRDRLEVPAPVVFAGFREPPPALRELALRLPGRAADFAPVQGAPGVTLRHAAATPARELDDLIAWLRGKLDADPAAELAVILPDLGQRFGEAERALTAALEPELQVPGTAAAERVFDLGGGPPLASWGLAADALGALRATRPQGIEFADVTQLLRARHLGDPAELGARARLDARLRERDPRPRWTVTALAAAAEQSGAVDFARRLRGAQDALGQGPRQRSARGWAEVFGAVLSAWGWPGPASLASDEFQVARALREQLAGLADLESVGGRMTATEALAVLTRSCSSPFQPERGAARVTVLEALEATAVDYDGLWVAGLTAARWPLPAAPDPFLPMDIQRSLALPGTTPARALAEAEVITAAWRTSAGEVVLSWPCREDDAEVQGSFLVPGGLPWLGQQARAPSLARAMLVAAESALEVVPPHAAPPVAADAARGGARLIELQARCPFRAFAELRLGAVELGAVSAGLDARARGTVLHRVLELFYEQVPSQEALVAMGAERRHARVTDCVERSMREKLPAGLGERFLELERRWLELAVGLFLERELTREAYVVEGHEQEIVREVGGLTLRLRMDRVDRVGDALVLLDYKTGKPSLGGWRGSRPDQPQLPLYAARYGEPVAAVAFARLSTADPGYDGAGADAALLPKLRPAAKLKLTDDGRSGFDWGQVLAHWSAAVERLAGEHAAGRAEVDPKQPQTCRGCHLPVLCRVGSRFASDEDLVELEHGD
jgi:probable DNA repair protein